MSSSNAAHPVVIVDDRTGPTCEAVRVLAEAAGRTCVPAPDVPADPWDLTDLGLACVLGSDTTPAAVAEAAVALATRGVAVIVSVPRGTAVPHRVLDAWRRAGDLHDWRNHPIVTLAADDVRLLVAIGEGATIGHAASSTHMSTRTAHRRLVWIRDALGVDTNTAAIAKVNAAVRALRPS